MCRNIKTLFNFDPPATDDEMKAAVVQFVKKVGGSAATSKANQEVFEAAVGEIELSVSQLLASLVTNAPAKNREVEAEKARARYAKRKA